MDMEKYQYKQKTMSAKEKDNLKTRQKLTKKKKKGTERKMETCFTPKGEAKRNPRITMCSTCFLLISLSVVSIAPTSKGILAYPLVML